VDPGIVRREGVVGRQDNAWIGVRGRKGHAALIVDGRVAIRVQGADGDIEGGARLDAGWSGEGEKDGSPWRSEVQCDPTWKTQALDQNFLSGAIEVGSSDVATETIIPVHLAASQIKSDATGWPWFRTRISWPEPSRLARRMSAPKPSPQ